MSRLLMKPLSSMNRRLLLYSTSAAAVAVVAATTTSLHDDGHDNSLSFDQRYLISTTFCSRITPNLAQPAFNQAARILSTSSLSSSLSSSVAVPMAKSVIGGNENENKNGKEKTPPVSASVPNATTSNPTRLIETPTILEFGAFEDFGFASDRENSVSPLYDTTVIIGRKDSLQNVVLDNLSILNNKLLGPAFENLPKPMAKAMMSVMDDKKGGSTSTLLLRRSAAAPSAHTGPVEMSSTDSIASSMETSDAADAVAPTTTGAQISNSDDNAVAHRLSFGGLPIKNISRNNHSMSVHALTRKVRALCPNKSRTRVIVLVPDIKPRKKQQQQPDDGKNAASAAADHMSIAPLAIAVAKAFPTFSMKTKKVNDPETVAAVVRASPPPSFSSVIDVSTTAIISPSNEETPEEKRLMIIADNRPAEESRPRSVYVVFARESDGSIIDDPQSLQIASSVASGVRLASRIVDTPPEMMNVPEFANEARLVAEQFPDTVKLTEISGEDLKPYGGIYGVGKGAQCPPRMVILEYNPKGFSSSSETAQEGTANNFGSIDKDDNSDEASSSDDNVELGQPSPTSPQLLSTSAKKNKKKKQQQQQRANIKSNEKMETIAFVGKGIVYDSGGLSLKPKNLMPGMKRDVGGAAAALGGFYAAAQLGVEKKVYCILMLAENSIGPNAMRNDDILTLYSGKTIEVNNTDAEGRLLLSDGVAHATKHFPDLDIVIDMATLTGAQHITTGKKHAGIMANTVQLQNRVMKAGSISGDLCFPLIYAPDLLLGEFDSKVADMRNSARLHNNAAASCAGHFIETHLHDKYKGGWIHIDMSGPNFFEQRSTGYGIGLVLGILEAPGFR